MSRNGWEPRSGTHEPTAVTLGVVGQAHKGYISDETVRGSLIREGLPLTKKNRVFCTTTCIRRLQFFESY